jgi:hypothetical protein
LWVELGSELTTDESIHAYSTIHNEFVGSATARNSSVGDYLIQAHFGHLAIHSRQSLGALPHKDGLQLLNHQGELEA